MVFRTSNAGRRRGWTDSAPSWAASRRETALPARRARCRGLLDGVGRRPIRHRGDSEGVARRSACGFFAGCRLARGRSAPRRLPRAFGAPLRETRICALATARDGVIQQRTLTRRQFQILPPRHLNFFGQQPTHALAPSTARNKRICSRREQQQLSQPATAFLSRCALLVARPRLDEV